MLTRKEILGIIDQLSNKIKTTDAEELDNFLNAIKDIQTLSSSNIISLFTNLNTQGTTVIELVIKKSFEHLKILLNHKIIADLNNSDVLYILSYKDQAKNTPIELSFKEGYSFIDVILKSRAFKSLNSEQTFLALDTKCEQNYNILWPLIKSGTQELNAVFKNNDLISKLDEEQKTRILNNSNLLNGALSKENLKNILESDFLNSMSNSFKVRAFTNPQGPNGDTVIRSFIRKGSIELLNLFLNNKSLFNLTSEEKYIVISSTWKDQPHIFKLIAKYNQSIIEEIFKSSVFNSLDITNQKEVIFFSKDISFWECFSKQKNYADKFLNNSNLPNSLSHFFKEHFFQVVEFSGRFTVNKQDVFKDVLLKVVKDYSPYKMVADNQGYSLLYYLTTKGYNSTIIKSFQNDGFVMQTPDNHKIEIFNNYNLYSFQYSNITILYLRGPDGSKPINIPGLVSVLHKNRANVLTIDIRDNNDVDSATIQSIIKNYKIDKIIINAHGAGNQYSGMPEIYYGEKLHKKPECTDTEIFIFKKEDNNVMQKHNLPEGNGYYLPAKILLKEIIVPALNHKPISVFITSCNGQLIENWSDELPSGSTIITIGEHNCKSMVIHGRVGDLAHIPNFIHQSNFSFEDLLMYYLVNIKHSLATPTYIKVGEETISLAKLQSGKNWINGLSDVKEKLVIDKLCFNQNEECTINLTRVIDSLQNGSLSYEVEKFKVKNASAETKNTIGIIEALNFYYTYYCADVFEEVSSDGQNELLYICSIGHPVTVGIEGSMNEEIVL